MGEYFDPTYYLDKALQLDPKNKKVAQLHANLLIDKEEYVAAIEFLKSFQSDHGTQEPDINNLLANAYLKANDIENAEASISQALSESPRSISLLKTAFLIKKSIGDKFSAIHFLERIIRLDDNNTSAYWELSQLLDNEDELVKRINLLEIVYSLDFQNLRFLKELILNYCNIFKTDRSLFKINKYNDALLEHAKNPKFEKLSPSLKRRAIKILKEFI